MKELAEYLLKYKDEWRTHKIGKVCTCKFCLGYEDRVLKWYNVALFVGLGSK